MNNILVTGGYGFIGSNFIKYFLKKHTNYNIFNLDSLTYAADKKNLLSVENDVRYKFIEGDIRNKNLVNDLFEEYKFCGVFHFAAESHVDNSIDSPEVFIQTNVLGTFNLINAAYNCWMESPFQHKNDSKNFRFHHVSTDEVYGSLGEIGLFSEHTPIAPNSPYSASKASSDMIIRSYFHTYGMNCIISNCSNNYGPQQNEEKLIPKTIKNALSGKPIPIYGNGKNIRDWLYVDDHCSAIDAIFHHGKSGEVYNIGGDCEKTNIEIVNTICSILNDKVPTNSSYNELIKFVSDRPGHDFRYAIDSTKIKSELNWLPKHSFEKGIEKTIDWYISND